VTEILFKDLSFGIIGAAMEVHKILGPGFLESVYQAALEKELTLRRIPFCHQIELPVTYKGDIIGIYKADLVIDDKIIVEIKGISRLNPSHQAQALHYLAATGLQLAILINFGMSSLEYRRVVKSENKDSRQFAYTCPGRRCRGFVAKEIYKLTVQSLSRRTN
jgi:GxxExxY protein